MGLMERSIETLRSDINENRPLENINYKEIYPITVLEAVKEEMSKDSKNLKSILEEIYESLSYKQKIVPSKSSNNLMTYGGIEGAIGSIPMTHSIEVEPELWSDDKIPTEKAVGELLKSYGVFDGTLSEKQLWSNIVNKPSIVNELGTSKFALISQFGITNIIDSLSTRLDEKIDEIDTTVNETYRKLNSHINNSNNPHNLLPSTIGAASQEDFQSHINNHNNPHNINKEQIGLGSVDNTSDMDKPISKATQDALDRINSLLRGLGVDIDNFRYLSDLTYDVTTGRLVFIFNDGSQESTIIGTNELIDDVKFDENSHTLIFTEVSGNKIRIDLSSLYVEGYSSDNINVEIGPDGEIIATLKSKSITSDYIKDKGITGESIADDTITNKSIKDFTITGNKLAAGSITSSKIFAESIQEGHIAPRAVTGEKLFSSIRDKSFLFVNQKGTDPVWLPLSSNMLPDDLIKTEHISDKSVTSEKIAKDINLLGNPKVNGISIASHDYVAELISKSLLVNINLDDRSVDGRVLFSSPIKNRILGVYEVNQDPMWGLVNHDMLDINIIGNDNIMDKTITDLKFADDAIKARSIGSNEIISRHIRESNITSEKIFKANQPNMILASDSTLHPVYSKVTEQMLDLESVNSQNIKNQSVTLDKLQHSDDSYTLLATLNKNTDPQWVKIKTQMLEDSSISKEKLFTADNDNVILGAKHVNDHPEFMKVNSDMMEDGFLQDRHIPEGTIKRYHLDPDIFYVPETEIVPDEELRKIKKLWFRSGLDNVILSINNSNGLPIWSKVTTNLIEDNSVTLQKIKKSNFPNRIIAVGNNIDNSPEYTLLKNEMIEDDQISSSKLVSDLLFYGRPHIENHPDINSNDTSIASTKWVNDKINKITNIDTLEMQTDRIPNHSISLSKLEVTSNKPRVLGIKNNNVEFLKVSEDMLENESVSTNKLQRDLTLLGSPRLEIRPTPLSSDDTGTGDQIVDSQWVTDRLKRNDSEFYEKLQEKISCLQPPDPEKLDAHHIRVQSIGLEDIEKIVNDEIDTVPIRSSNIDYKHKIGPIPYDHIEGIILGQIEPDDADFYADDDFTISSITSSKLLKIINHQISLEVDPNYYDIYNGYSENDCKCFEGKDYAFIISIKEEDVSSILNKTASPLLYADISYNDTLFSTISRQEIYNIIHDINDIESEEEILINNQVIKPISDERLEDILLNGYQSEFTKLADITLYEEYEKVFEGVPLTHNSVITSFIQDRAVNGKKLFTSAIKNMVLAVIEPNSDPIYTKVTHDMVEDWIIQTKLIESTSQTNMILGVKKSYDEPFWMKINHDMLEDNLIHTNNILDENVTHDKLANWNIREDKLAKEAMINTVHLHDNAVTNRKIKDRSITANKIARNQKIPAYTTVEENIEYSRRSLRNTIISSHIPEQSYAGDIWFMI